MILLFSAITNGELLPSRTISLQEMHLLGCLTHISHKYFAPGRSLLISSPSTYGDLQQLLIAEIHRTAIWPVVVTVDGNISKADKTDYIDGDGSYIILIPDGNIEILKNENLFLPVLRNKFTRFWNSEARFVVAGANEFSMSQQKDIFDFFSKLRMYNCIIVSPEQDVVDEEYGTQINENNVNKFVKLGVYTWFPYQSTDSCTEVKDITLLDSWFNSAQGHFTKNTELFPRKVKSSLNGCPMKAVVEDGDWNLTTSYINETDSNGNVFMKVVGMEMDLLRVVLQQMNMTFDHIPTPEDINNDNRSLTDDLFWAMIEKEADIALGDMLLDTILYSYLDCTNTYYIFNTRWYVPCSDKYPRWSSIFRILSVELWLVLILSIVIAAISTTLVGRYSWMSEWQSYQTLTSSMTNIWAVILGVSVSNMPRTPSLRSLFLAWVCFSVAFSTVFQAFLTTFLVDSGYKTPIQNMDELFASGIKLAYFPGGRYIFEGGDETEVSKVQTNSVICPSDEVCIDWLKDKKNASILLSDDDAEEYFALGLYCDEYTRPFLCGIEDGVFLHTGLTMIMLHGDPLIGRVTEIIDRVVAAGIFNYWNSLRMYTSKLSSLNITIFHPLDGYYSFKMHHMQPAFYFLLMGLCLSLLCFLVEIFYNRLLSKRN